MHVAVKKKSGYEKGKRRTHLKSPRTLVGVAVRVALCIFTLGNIFQAMKKERDKLIPKVEKHECVLQCVLQCVFSHWKINIRL